MTVKKVPAKSVLRSSHDITLAEISAVAEKTIPALFEEASKLNLEVAGPVEFTYVGMDGRPETTFELIVSLPIKKRKKASKNDSAQFKQARTKPFRCATTEHLGSIANIANTYMALCHEMNEAGLKQGDECREVYQHWVAFDSPQNITEVQVGLN